LASRRVLPVLLAGQFMALLDVTLDGGAGRQLP
jgi:hypothetical protein